MRTSACSRTLSSIAVLAVLMASGSIALPIDTAFAQLNRQCQDGLDNDNDGAADYPNDFGCISADDNDELYTKSQCQDGYDNDLDGQTDLNDPSCTDRQDNDESSLPGRPQCRDGIDNDSDGTADYPNDFSCSSADDADEGWPRAQCQDGYDNDADGLIDFPQDPACTGVQDNDEKVFSTNFTNCSDGIDNDGDGAIDYPNDASCASPNAIDERYPVLACQDGIDNDRDGKTDYPNDLGCTGAQDSTEEDASRRTSQCGDGVDNDGDGAADFPFDYSCSSVEDSDETKPEAECEDKKDNDGDGFSDYPEDPGCISTQDNDEGNATSMSQCRDGIDNDGDGAVDYPNDFGCASGDDTDEVFPKSKCQDGHDNDNDGLVDFPQDSGCENPQDNNEKNVGKVTLVLTANPDPLAAGDEIRYSLVFRNNGNAAQTDLRVQQNLPAGLTFLSATEGGYNRYDGIILWARITVPAYSTKTLTLSARADPGLTPGKKLQTLVYVNDTVMAEYTSTVKSQPQGAFLQTPGNFTPPYPVPEGGVYVPQYDNPSQPYNAYSPVQDTQSYGMAEAASYDPYAGETPLLPVTGIEDFTRPLEDLTRFLRPVSSNSPGLPGAMWALVTVIGMLTGGVLSKKYFV